MHAYVRTLLFSTLIAGALGCDPAWSAFGTVAPPDGTDPATIVIQGYELGDIGEDGLPRAGARQVYGFTLDPNGYLDSVAATETGYEFLLSSMGHPRTAEWIAWVDASPSAGPPNHRELARPDEGDHALDGPQRFDTGARLTDPGLYFEGGRRLGPEITPRTVIEVSIWSSGSSLITGDEFSEVDIQVVPLGAESCGRACALYEAEDLSGDGLYTLDLELAAEPLRVQVWATHDGNTFTGTSDALFIDADGTVGGADRAGIELSRVR